MSCYHWRHSHKANIIKDMECMKGSQLAMVLVTGALVYLGAKTIHHLIYD